MLKYSRKSEKAASAKEISKKPGEVLLKIILNI